MCDGLGGLSTSLGFFASPPLILSTESVVVMEWKGKSTAIATRSASLGRPQEMLQLTCSCPSTPSPRLIRSRVSVVDLQRVPARCSIRPVRRSKLQVAVCSRADVSHGLFLRHMHRAVRQDAREHITRFLEYKTACRAPIRTCTELYGSATSAWVKVLP